MNRPETSFDENSKQPDLPPARLAGKSLEAWYGNNRPRSSEDRQPPQENKESRRAATAATSLLVILTLMALANIVIPVFGPFLASLLGIWLVIGGYNIFARCFSVLAALLFLTIKAGNGALNIGTWSQLYLASLTMCTFLAAVLTYVAAVVVSRACRAPSRLAQFSLRELGGFILAIGLAAALTRSGVIEYLQQPPWNADQRAILVSLIAVSVNTVLASLSVLVPKLYRDGKLMWISMGIVLVVTPAVEGSIFANWFRIPLPIAILGTAVLHGVAAMMVWSIVFPLETAGAFRDHVSASPADPVDSCERETLE